MVDFAAIGQFLLPIFFMIGGGFLVMVSAKHKDKNGKGSDWRFTALLGMVILMIASIYMGGATVHGRMLAEWFNGIIGG